VLNSLKRSFYLMVVSWHYIIIFFLCVSYYLSFPFLFISFLIFCSFFLIFKLIIFYLLMFISSFIHLPRRIHSSVNLVSLGNQSFFWILSSHELLFFYHRPGILLLGALISCAWRLHPGTKKARKGNVGTSVEWRLNSENDSRLHGQPSFVLSELTATDEPFNP